MKKTSSVFYWMTIPAFILFFVFHTLPALQGIFYSFTDYIGFGDYAFVGFRNFINLLNDGRAFDAYIFTFKFAIVSTIIVNILSLLIALGLNAKIKFKDTFRAIYFVPYMLSILVVGYIFNHIFTFIVPEIGRNLGIDILSKNILGNMDLAWVGVVILAVWNSSGFNTLLYLSGLQTVPDELYEVAKIDGAGKWDQFKHITFPLIAPFFTINIVISMRGFLMVFDHIMALTQGGPGRATESITLLIYNGGFMGGEFAYQTANAVVFLIVVLSISLFQIKVLQKREVDY
ncbi:MULTISPECIES: carbohydrate ABC transporter permease [Halanaerobium]|jgi:raffinose/stachyose/melibiose transport system permease protein|uniref:Carbohydrate ABC transporter membrane protein 1 (CUT1 family) n=1 Tax=Halanaerobium saccharolyticum TaxID=43595 RepID=A0A4V3CXR3_9FIRM|nr:MULTISPECIES: sugar ABC transporter permease [Halanaerobium]RCW62321.1 carbohydrate ABC transporter membrane protein 1 (CUT1 family) [Halanaerobium sp. ST460_2HS_T2]TDP91298.1 carbohydrate ABC transporter membrane protein 1 (CUT1 family) [Halanaerobium saccharolyticum]